MGGNGLRLDGGDFSPISGFIANKYGMQITFLLAIGVFVFGHVCDIAKPKRVDFLGWCEGWVEHCLSLWQNLC